MIRVILVEDEPSAMRILKSIIEIKCNGYEIIGTAENGEEGLEKARLFKPDIVITDIKMGIMDGIQLISKIKEEIPYIYSIIVSGYQDFEYAKGAIKVGASDYLLKPINAKQLESTLDIIKAKLQAEYCEKRGDFIKKILSGSSIESWKIERYFPSMYYSVAILRKNGLPPRFSLKHGSSYDGISLDVNSILKIKENDDIWTIYGRDEQELIFFYGSKIQNHIYFEKLVKEIGENLNCGYHNIIFSSNKFEIMEVTKIIPSMYQLLDRSIIIGISQEIYSNKDVLNVIDKPATLDNDIVNKIAYFLTNLMYDSFRKELDKLFEIWKKEKCTELWVENRLRLILHYVEKYSIESSKKKDYNVEFLLDEALYYSMSFNDLKVNIWDIVERITRHNDIKKHKMNSIEFFKSIQKYVEKNLAEEISLQSICSIFEISQPYLSRLFRKHENISFNEYLTQKRIGKAKKLMEENSQIPLKDIALFVGYSDPFYFSRVFRSVIGVPPSEYVTNNIRR